MKNFLISLLTAGLALGAQAVETQTLPAPVTTGGMPVLDAINTRASQRDFDPARAVDKQTLSNILWAAWGMNNHGTRTIPTSRNRQNMQLYVLTPEGAWRYEGETNTLVKLTDENLIPHCDRQTFVKDAPVHLVYAIKEDSSGYCHVGSAYQNVYLYATSAGLSCVVRGMIDKPALTKGLLLPEGQVVVMHQCLGWPKAK